MTRLRPATSLMSLLVLASCGIAGCRSGKLEATGETATGAAGAAAALPPAVAAPVAIDAATDRPSGRTYAPPEPWARWPMPNAHLPGLPNPHSYDTQTNGVVVDRVTGLMWQRNLNDKFFTFQNAQQRCAELTLAGHDDWRLPSRIELVSLIDTTRTQPSIDTDAFPDTPSDWFWTSSPAADIPSAAWYVYFYFGYPKTDDRTNRFSVRCVRVPTPRPTPATRYEIKAAEVRDVATGLRWQRAVPPKTFQFDAARSYCAHLALAGKKGWRVPSMVELLTLIDERAASPMIDATAFPGTPGEPFWTSSTFANGTALMWYVRFDQGSGLYGRPIEPFRVRCVL